VHLTGGFVRSLLVVVRHAFCPMPRGSREPCNAARGPPHMLVCVPERLRLIRECSRAVSSQLLWCIR